MSQGTALSKSAGKYDVPSYSRGGRVWFTFFSFYILISGGRFEIRGWTPWEEGQKKGPWWPQFAERRALPGFLEGGEGTSVLRESNCSCAIATSELLSSPLHSAVCGLQARFIRI